MLRIVRIADGTGFIGSPVIKTSAIAQSILQEPGASIADEWGSINPKVEFPDGQSPTTWVAVVRFESDDATYEFGIVTPYPDEGLAWVYAGAYVASCLNEDLTEIRTLRVRKCSGTPSPTVDGAYVHDGDTCPIHEADGETGR